MTDERVDAYIAKAAPFAQPILSHLRELVHRADPQATETIKWGFPHFEHKGILCSMAAFKEHCTFGFWKAELMTDPEHVLAGVGKTAMGHFGRIQNLDDLPRDDVLVAYIQEAARLNETGAKAPQRAAAAVPLSLKRRSICFKRCEPMKRRRRPLRTSRLIRSGSMWSGWLEPKRRRHGLSAWPRLWNGCRKAKSLTGSTQSSAANDEPLTSQQKSQHSRRHSCKP